MKIYASTYITCVCKYIRTDTYVRYDEAPRPVAYFTAPDVSGLEPYTYIQSALISIQHSHANSYNQNASIK